jgi:outer membrane protein insertion porin family
MDEEFAGAAVNYVDKQQQPNNWLTCSFTICLVKTAKKI